MHPTPLPAEAAGETLVYVWGYPLALSVLVRLVGFDRVDYHSILYYKLLSLFSLGLTAGLLYLFYRRRLSRGTSVFLAACVVFAAMDELDSLYSDLFFLLLHVGCLSSAEYFCRSLAAGEQRRALRRGIGLGLLLLAAYETRLNGAVDCAIVAGVQLLSWERGQRRRGKTRLLPFVPWLVFGAGFVLCTLFVLHPATGNLSDVAALDRAFIWENRSRYAYIFYQFLTSVPGLPFLNTFVTRPSMGRIRLLALLPVLLTGLGMLRCLKRDRAALPYLVFLPASLVVLILLPYFQGLRYCYPMLPLLALFFGMGLEEALGFLFRRSGERMRICLRAAGLALSAALFLNAAAQAWQPDLGQVLRGEFVRAGAEENAYSDSALNMYHFIQANTPPESVIAFFKPRALYLNTGRESFTDNVDGNRYRPRDYILVLGGVGEASAETEVLHSYGSAAVPVYENRDFVLYRIEEEASGH